MYQVRIIRGPSTPEGTFGLLSILNADFNCVTGELPYDDDLPDVSCIDPIITVVKYLSSKRWGMCYQIQNVPGRTGCEFHPGNLCGSVSNGYVSQVEGCVLLGARVSVFSGGVPPAGKLDQRGVTDSVNTLRAFQHVIGFDDFQLEII